MHSFWRIDPKIVWLEVKTSDMWISAEPASRTANHGSLEVPTTRARLPRSEEREIWALVKMKGHFPGFSWLFKKCIFCGPKPFNLQQIEAPDFRTSPNSEAKMPVDSKPIKALAELFPSSALIAKPCQRRSDFVNYVWLVVWNIFYFPIYWEFHHPN